MGQIQHAYAVPALGAAPLVIRCTKVTSKMVVEETPTNNDFQGLSGNRLKALAFGAVFVEPLFATTAPIVIEGYPGDHPPHTVPIGNGGSSPLPVGPGGPVTMGTKVLQLTSATATPTNVLVTESF